MWHAVVCDLIKARKSSSSSRNRLNRKASRHPELAERETAAAAAAAASNRSDKSAGGGVNGRR